MLTPQEVSEHAFAKASFGGYNMAMVDEFLDALTEDYTALYKENAVLKSKMKVLVDKVEEYRSTEDAMRKALLTAQRLADEMVQEAEQKKAALLAQAETEARQKIADLRSELDAEDHRLAAARAATAGFVAQMKDLCGKELMFLNQVGELTAPAPKAPDPVVTAAQEIESSLERITQKEPEAAPVPEEERGENEDTIDLGDLRAAAEEPRPTADDELPGGLYEDIAASVVGAKTREGMEEVHFEITLGQPKAESVPESVSAPEPPPRRLAADDSPTQRIDFDHLLFGKDYEIK
ncbi:MAG: DivIVA domain-containing protein [Clostridia bacterium]|nr:DivIVA domain-containing protein [Clostridia bacterium]